MPPKTNLRLDGARLLARLDALRLVGDTGDGGARRIAGTDADKAGRDLLVRWLTDTGLAVHVDRIGNIVGVLEGREPGAAVVLGSHIDTVATGGKYDGALGVVAGLEVVAAMTEAGIVPRRPVAVVAFTNEEGARFQPDMLGACVWAGRLSLEAALAATDSDGIRLGDELARIGYAGTATPGFLPVRAYLELHIEQGPVLDAEGGGIGAVTGVQAIWWSELTLTGEANHAGTTPMRYRRNPAVAAAEVILCLERLTREIDGTVANTGRIVTVPGNINVVSGEIRMSLDIRHPDDGRLAEVERRLVIELAAIASRTGITFARRDLARFPAQPFDPALVDLIETTARAHGHPVRRMISGAGHDAQMMARLAPTAMIFVPSIGGISHNPAEATCDADCLAGADLLLAVTRRLADA